MALLARHSLNLPSLPFFALRGFFRPKMFGIIGAVRQVTHSGHEGCKSVHFFRVKVEDELR